MADGRAKTVRLDPRKVAQLTANLERYVRSYLETVLPYGTDEAKRMLELLEVQRIIREGEAEHRAGRTKRLRSLRPWRGKKAA
ncbi:MAG: hypothetical protein G01um101438_693 [Parcubacteria group bacterium Gr01-1014_38]|nr:MAG: hypothetical protein G01um101438_693 [Parcubacteria group bacterium Gr01-1014_38]